MGALTVSLFQVFQIYLATKTPWLGDVGTLADHFQNNKHAQTKIDKMFFWHFVLFFPKYTILLISDMKKHGWRAS